MNSVTGQIETVRRGKNWIDMSCAEIYNFIFKEKEPSQQSGGIPSQENHRLSQHEARAPSHKTCAKYARRYSRRVCWLWDAGGAVMKLRKRIMADNGIVRDDRPGHVSRRRADANGRSRGNSDKEKIKSKSVERKMHCRDEEKRGRRTKITIYRD